jgi:hypothetical protein
MKPIKALFAFGCVLSLLTSLALAADAPAKAETKGTCCQQAAAKDKACTHKCCVAAHKDGRSCEKCNPNKEDLKLIKKAEKKAPAAKP